MTIQAPPDKATSTTSPLALFALMLCTALGGLSSSSITAAVPVLDEHLRSTWLVPAYFLGAALSAVTAGRVADVVGPRRVAATGLTAIIPICVLAAFATSGVFLAATRFLLGAATASLFPSAVVLIRHVRAPGTAHVAGLAAISLATELTFAGGPSLGSALVQLGGWQLVVLAPVPLALLAAGLLLTVLPRDPAPARPHGLLRRLDPLGLVLLGTAAGATLTALQQPGPNKLIIGLFGAAVMVAILITWERRSMQALFPPAVMSRSLLAVYARTVAYYGGLYVLVLLVPVWLADVRHLGTGTAAVVTAGLPVVAVLSCLLTPWVIRRTGPRAPLVIGAAALAVAAGFLGAAGQHTSPVVLAVSVALCGVPADLYLRHGGLRGTDRTPHVPRSRPWPPFATQRPAGVVDGPARHDHRLRRHQSVRRRRIRRRDPHGHARPMAARLHDRTSGKHVGASLLHRLRRFIPHPRPDASLLAHRQSGPAFTERARARLWCDGSRAARGGAVRHRRHQWNGRRVPGHTGESPLRQRSRHPGLRRHVRQPLVPVPGNDPPRRGLPGGTARPRPQCLPPHRAGTHDRGPHRCRGCLRPRRRTGGVAGRPGRAGIHHTCRRAESPPSSSTRTTHVRHNAFEAVLDIIHNGPCRLLCQCGPLNQHEFQVLRRLSDECGLALCDSPTRPGTVSRYRDSRPVRGYLGTLGHYGTSAAVNAFLRKDQRLHPPDELCLFFLASRIAEIATPFTANTLQARLRIVQVTRTEAHLAPFADLPLRTDLMPFLTWLADRARVSPAQLDRRHTAIDEARDTAPELIERTPTNPMTANYFFTRLNTVIEGLITERAYTYTGVFDVGRAGISAIRNLARTGPGLSGWYGRALMGDAMASLPTVAATQADNVLAFIGDGAAALVPDVLPTLVQEVCLDGHALHGNLSIFRLINGAHSLIRTYQERRRSVPSDAQSIVVSLIDDDWTRQFGPLTVTHQRIDDVDHAALQEQLQRDNTINLYSVPLAHNNDGDGLSTQQNWRCHGDVRSR